MKSLVELVKPGGQLFMSTINRTPMAFLQTIVIAEYLLNFVPKGTHDFNKYLTPDELKTLVKTNNLEFGEINDIVYNPLAHSFSLQSSIPLYPIDYIPIIGKELAAPMNYIIQAKKPLV
jgi:ubiquinone biosynthesis O-methyltransferase